MIPFPGKTRTDFPDTDFSLLCITFAIYIRYLLFPPRAPCGSVLPGASTPVLFPRFRRSLGSPPLTMLFFLPEGIHFPVSIPLHGPSALPSIHPSVREGQRLAARSQGEGQVHQRGSVSREGKELPAGGTRRQRILPGGEWGSGSGGNWKKTYLYCESNRAMMKTGAFILLENHC